MAQKNNCSPLEIQLLHEELKKCGSRLNCFAIMEKDISRRRAHAKKHGILREMSFRENQSLKNIISRQLHHLNVF